MTSIKTIAVTAVIAVAGTFAAFSGLHLGQSPADASTASQPVKAKTTYSVTLTAKQLQQLMHGQNVGATQRATHHVRHAQRHVTRHQQSGTHSYNRSHSSRNYGSSGYSGSRSYGNGYRCYNNGGGSSHSWGGSGGGSGGGGCW